MVVKANPEFGIELALVVPYAYWLHEQGKLDTVITSKGMKPFYYFCDDVREEFEERTIDNAAAGLNELPNNWIHGTKGIGDLNYDQWKLPPYKDYYKNDEIDFGKPVVFISNIYNFEHGRTQPFNTFGIKILYEMFDYLSEKGYAIIYKRSNNTNPKIAIDNNEHNSQQLKLQPQAEVEGIGTINDYELTAQFENVHLFDNLVNKGGYSYNELQLMIMANTNKFISVCGGNAILSSCFGSPVVIYVNQGREFRPNYFAEGSYWRKLSGADIMPVYDAISVINNEKELIEYGHTINYSGTNDYSNLLQTIKGKF